MISHQHRCIFIHIPRTAGSSIEAWLQGSNQWRENPEEKHLTSIQARQRYGAHWDDYFKFTIIRNPYERVASLLSKFNKYYGLRVRDGAVRFGNYKGKFGFPLTLEHDIRFFNYQELLDLSPFTERGYHPNCVYGNMLTEDLDAVYRFEDLPAAVASIAEALSLPNPELPRLVATTSPVDPLVARNKRTIARINELYRRDFINFNYPMIPTGSDSASADLTIKARPAPVES